MEKTSLPGTESLNKFLNLARHPIKFKLFLLQQLPAAFFSGVRVKSVSEFKTTVTVPYKWLTRNPFRSTYFASLSMAAEMSTGLLAMAYVYQREPKVSLLVVAIEGKFYKKATAPTSFVCEAGEAIRNAVEQSISLGTSQTVKALSSGYNELNELVAEFWITWSFKAK